MAARRESGLRRALAEVLLPDENADKGGEKKARTLPPAASVDVDREIADRQIRAHEDHKALRAYRQLPGDTDAQKLAVAAQSQLLLQEILFAFHLEDLVQRKRRTVAEEDEDVVVHIHPDPFYEGYLVWLRRRPETGVSTMGQRNQKWKSFAKLALNKATAPAKLAE